MAVLVFVVMHVEYMFVFV